MPKRKPIDYTPQFGSGIFRPKDEVESERTAIETATATPLAVTPSVAQKNQFERTTERSNERTDERIQKRHSFDVWQDQLISLTEIQTQIFHKTGRKPKLGELVQEALDAYIANQRVRTNERSNERTNVHVEESGEDNQRPVTTGSLQVDQSSGEAEKLARKKRGKLVTD